jgi:hypothetical protein
MKKMTLGHFKNMGLTDDEVKAIERELGRETFLSNAIDLMSKVSPFACAILAKYNNKSHAQ